MKRYLISGGGTGGHIFPAVSIANALKAKQPDCEILFVGALGRMEMERVPAAGYKIIGLPIAGFDRKNLLKNIAVLVKLGKSLLMARKIVKDFRPDVAIGVGGYASGAALRASNWLGVPTVLQEQNSYAGVTNKLLAKKASIICVAYHGMERFFPADKILLTGNPVRQNLMDIPSKAQVAYDYFHYGGCSLDLQTAHRYVHEALDCVQNVPFCYLLLTWMELNLEIYRSDATFRDTYIEEYKHALAFIQKGYEAASVKNREIWDRTLVLVNEMFRKSGLDSPEYVHAGELTSYEDLLK